MIAETLWDLFTASMNTVRSGWRRAKALFNFANRSGVMTAQGDGVEGAIVTCDAARLVGAARRAALLADRRYVVQRIRRELAVGGERGVWAALQPAAFRDLGIRPLEQRPLALLGGEPRLLIETRGDPLPLRLEQDDPQRHRAV